MRGERRIVMPFTIHQANLLPTVGLGLIVVNIHVPFYDKQLPHILIVDSIHEDGVALLRGEPRRGCVHGFGHGER